MRHVRGRILTHRACIISQPSNIAAGAVYSFAYFNKEKKNTRVIAGNGSGVVFPFFPPFFHGAYCSGVQTAGLCWILTGETDGGEIEHYDVHIGIC